MTTIATLQTRYRELGRLRMGQRVPTQSGGRRPEKLETWRFTSTDWRLIQRASELYGGKPERWDGAPSGTRQFQVTTDTDAIPVILPPDVAISQALEAWTAAGCIRRCDGEFDMVSGSECLCRQEAEYASGNDGPCRPTTRLSVLLPDMPGLGVWRLETHGWFAARELVPMVRLASTLGRGQTYRLRIDPRAQTSRQDDGKPVTYHFGVPVLDTDLTPGQLLELEAGGQGVALGAIESNRTTSQQSDPPAAVSAPPAGGRGGSDPTSEGASSTAEAEDRAERSGSRPSDPTSPPEASTRGAEGGDYQSGEDIEAGTRRKTPAGQSSPDYPSAAGSSTASAGTGDVAPAGSPAADQTSGEGSNQLQSTANADVAPPAGSPSPDDQSPTPPSHEPGGVGVPPDVTDNLHPVEEWAINQDPPVDLRVAKVALRNQFRTDFGWLQDWKDLQELEGEQAVNAIKALEAIYLDPGEGKH